MNLSGKGFLLLIFFSVLFPACCFTLNPDTINSVEAQSANAGKTSYSKAMMFTTFGFGPAAMYHFDDQKLAYNIYGGKYWLLNEITGLGLIGEFTSDLEKSHFIGVNINSSFFPLKSDISPYAGVDFGMAFARGSDKNVFGFSIGGSSGAHFFRSSIVQLILQIKALALLKKLPEGYPVTMQIRLGLLF